MNTIKIKDSYKIKRPSLITKIAGAVSENKVLILPTGTVYGISCRYDSRDSIRRIYKIKKRDKALPFIILISKLKDLKIFTSDINPSAKKIIKHFWNIKNPQPLTLVFNKNKNLKNFFSGGRSTIALRMAELRFLRDIINICGPIVSTSATISGTGEHPKKADEVPPSIRNNVDLIIDCQSELPGVESTIINVTGKSPSLIREGGIKFSDITGVINK
ncbi:MAG: L-threonylcarbamoyladenylate synthase [Actinomycetota bacterium]|nr:L-threonylcarbamoyladenylate synthase [Actinomycetota bacterium]